jgi:hypothetical protein
MSKMRAKFGLELRYTLPDVSDVSVSKYVCTVMLNLKMQQ